MYIDFTARNEILLLNVQGAFVYCGLMSTVSSLSLGHTLTCFLVRDTFYGHTTSECKIFSKIFKREATRTYFQAIMVMNGH